MIFIVALGAIVIMAPGVHPGGARADRAHPHPHRRPAPVREPGAVVVARRARRGHPEVPGGLRRPPRDPSPRRARDPDPEVRGSQLGAPPGALVGDHRAEHAHRAHPVPGHDDHRARALPGRATSCSSQDLSIGTALSVAAARHHRHPAAPAARAHLQRVPRRAGVVAATVPAVRRADPPRGRRERAAEPAVSTGPSRSSRSRSRTPTPRGPVLHDVSFTMEPGKVTALVGYTGAGKSSIAKLLGRTYDPDAGAVKVNGIDLRDLQLDSFRPRLGIVPQDPFVFKGTVASNIRYAKPGRDRRRGRGGDPRGRRLGPAVHPARPVRARRSRRKATTSPPRSASSSPSHAPGSRSPTSSCSTSPRRCSTPRSRTSSSSPSTASAARR